MEINARLTVKVFQKKVKDVGIFRIRKSSVELTIYRDDLEFLRFFCYQHKLYNSIKQSQLDLVNAWFELKVKNELNNKKKIKHLTKQCYEVNKLGKGRPLNHSLNDVLMLIEKN